MVSSRDFEATLVMGQIMMMPRFWGLGYAPTRLQAILDRMDCTGLCVTAIIVMLLYVIAHSVCLLSYICLYTLCSLSTE